MSSKGDMLNVMNDVELELNILRIGQRYHVRTPTYQYVGTLVACTGSVFLFEDTATVYETGPYDQFYAGKGGNVQHHIGAGRMVVDRAGTVLHEMNKDAYMPPRSGSVLG